METSGHLWWWRRDLCDGVIGTSVMGNRTSVMETSGPLWWRHRDLYDGTTGPLWWRHRDLYDGDIQTSVMGHLFPFNWISVVSFDGSGRTGAAMQSCQSRALMLSFQSWSSYAVLPELGQWCCPARAGAVIQSFQSYDRYAIAQSCGDCLSVAVLQCSRYRHTPVINLFAIMKAPIAREARHANLGRLSAT